MDTTTLELESNTHTDIVIDGHNNFHVTSVQVFTGDDDHNETECYSFESQNNQLHVNKLVPITVKKAKGRLRHEPGVRLFLDCETSDDSYLIEIFHHKGTIQVNTARL